MTRASRDDTALPTLSPRSGAPERHRALRAELARYPASVFVVCGVATDVCVRMAVEGFLDRGYAVTVVRDGIWGLGLQSDDALFAAWTARGARISSLAELEAEVSAGTPGR